MTHAERARQLKPYIEKAAKSLSDSDALKAIELYPNWAPNTTYQMNLRLRYDNKLWKVLQAHTSQEQYPPSIYTASLYVEVARPEQGDDPSNPIPYNNNMELIEGKYYSQNDVVYICTRSTGVAVYNDLSALVGIYVEIYTEVA